MTGGEGLGWREVIWAEAERAGGGKREREAKEMYRVKHVFTAASRCRSRSMEFTSQCDSSDTLKEIFSRTSWLRKGRRLTALLLLQSRFKQLADID